MFFLSSLHARAASLATMMTATIAGAISNDANFKFTFCRNVFWCLLPATQRSDPITWILIYGTMAVVCVMAAFEFLRPMAHDRAVCKLWVYAIILIPAFWTWVGSPDRSLLFDELAKMKFSYIEESREFLGLLICMTILACVG